MMHQGQIQEQILFNGDVSTSKEKAILISDEGDYILLNRLNWFRRILLKLRIYTGEAHGKLETFESLEYLGFRKWDKIELESSELLEKDINRFYETY